MPELRVIAWNILEGERLESVASTLSNMRPDIVLLNEVRNPLNGRDQVDYLVQQCSLPYHKYESTTSTGLTGTKGVAILSRYPLLQTQMHMVWGEGLPWPPTFGTLQATIQIDGLYHEVFTTRYRTLHTPGSEHYDETQEAQNRAGHKQAHNLVQNVPADRAVLVGGDFNANWANTDWSTELRDKSVLTDAVWQHSPYTMVPPESDCLTNRGNPPLVDLARRYDYLYYRYPKYRVSGATMKCALPGSDHPYVYATFVRMDRPAEENAAVVVRQEVPIYMVAGETYDVQVVMKNVGTNTWTPGGSNPYRLGPQNPQDNTTWGLRRVELPHPVAPGSEVTFVSKVTAPDVTDVVHFQ